MSIREIFFYFLKQFLTKSHSPHCSMRKIFIFSSLLLHCRLTTIWSNGKIFSINLTILAEHPLCAAKKVFWFFIRILLLSLYHHLIQRENFFDFSNLILKLPLAHHLNQRKIFFKLFQLYYKNIACSPFEHATKISQQNKKPSLILLNLLCLYKINWHVLALCAIILTLKDNIWLKLKNKH